MAKHEARAQLNELLSQRSPARRALPAGPQSTGALPPAPAHAAADFVAPERADVFAPIDDAAPAATTVPAAASSPAHAAAATSDGPAHAAAAISDGPAHAAAAASDGPAHAAPTAAPSAVEAPVSLKDAVQDSVHTASHTRNPALIVGLVLLVVGSVLSLLHLGRAGQLTASAASTATPMGSADIVEPVVVELTARDLLDASSYAQTLFAFAPHRELAHDPLFYSVLDADTLEDTQAFADLADVVGEIEDSGYALGIVLEDLETGATFAYNADEVFYSASSIKGPYVACIYETLAETGEADLRELSSYAAPIVISSDNGAYANMHRRYGGDEFARWLAELGCGTGEYEDYNQMGEHFYVHIDAWQLAAMWECVYTYLTSGTEATEQLAGYFEAREFSAIKMALGEHYVTWGKAGWYPTNDGYAWPSTVDAGVVWAEHPYLVVVMSDIPDNMQRLSPVISALDELHEGLCLTGTGDGVAAGVAYEQISSRNADGPSAEEV